MIRESRREATRLKREIEEGIIEYYAWREEDKVRETRRTKEHLCGTLITDPNDLLVLLTLARRPTLTMKETSNQPHFLN